MRAPADAEKGLRVARSSRRNTIKTAAVTVLAEHGPRGFTHRAVDSAAGLAAGTVNYYASSRSRLMILACEEVLECDADASQAHYAATAPASLGAMVEATLGYLETMSAGHGAVCTIARHHLESEALVHAEVAAAIAPRRRRIADAVHSQLVRIGRPVTPAVIALFQIQLDGLLAQQAFPHNEALSPDHLLDAVTRLFRASLRDTHHTAGFGPHPSAVPDAAVWYPPHQRR